jgi:DNA-binding transcriptional MerR regulator
MKQTYSIGDTAKMTGATQKQIRNWEAKGFIPEAGRIASGARAYRRFTLDEIDTICGIKRYLDEGFNLKAAVNKTANQKTGGIN